MIDPNASSYYCKVWFGRAVGFEPEKPPKGEMFFLQPGPESKPLTTDEIARVVSEKVARIVRKALT